MGLLKHAEGENYKPKNAEPCTCLGCRQRGTGRREGCPRILQQDNSSAPGRLELPGRHEGRGQGLQAAGLAATDLAFALTVQLLTSYCLTA